jgi:uncharacterized protein
MIARFFTYRAMAALVALALIGIAQPVTAQTQTPGPEPSLASVLIAKQIVEIKGVRQMFEPLVHGVIQKVKEQFLQTNIMWAKDINEIAAKMQTDFEPRGGELVDATARIYASHFTEEELKGILTFYQSPLGKKMVVEEPKALDEAMINAGEWGDTLAEEVIAKMRAEMKKRGHDL